MFGLGCSTPQRSNFSLHFPLKDHFEFKFAQSQRPRGIFVQMKVLGRISVRVKGAGMHGCQVTETHPCPGKHGLHFQKKKIWVHYTQDLKKKGYIFREQSLKMGTFPAKMTPNNGYEPGGGYSTLTWTEVCRPDLGTLTHV